MPNTASAKKALRQNEKRRAVNLAKKRQIKRDIKEYKRLVGARDIEDATRQLSVVYKTLDKAAGSGIIKKNKSSRLKSRLSTLLKKDLGKDSSTKSDTKSEAK